MELGSDVQKQYAQQGGHSHQTVPTLEMGFCQNEGPNHWLCLYNGLVVESHQNKPVQTTINTLPEKQIEMMSSPVPIHLFSLPNPFLATT